MPSLHILTPDLRENQNFNHLYWQRVRWHFLILTTVLAFHRGKEFHPMLIQRKPTVTMHSNVEKKKKRGGNRWKTQHVFAPPVCRDQSCPEVSQHSDQIQSFIYPGWERGGRKQGRTRADISENMQTSQQQKKKPRGGNKTCKLLAGNCPPANKLT